MVLLKKQETISEELGDRARVQRSYGNQALILTDWGRLEEGMALLKKEEALCHELGDRGGACTKPLVGGSHSREKRPTRGGAPSGPSGPRRIRGDEDASADRSSPSCANEAGFEIGRMSGDSASGASPLFPVLRNEFVIHFSLGIRNKLGDAVRVTTMLK